MNSFTLDYLLIAYIEREVKTDDRWPHEYAVNKSPVTSKRDPVH